MPPIDIATLRDQESGAIDAGDEAIVAYPDVDAPGCDGGVVDVCLRVASRALCIDDSCDFSKKIATYNPRVFVEAPGLIPVTHLLEVVRPDPMDRCRVTTSVTGASFRCASGPHPSAEVAVEAGAVVVRVTRGTAARVVARANLGGRCVVFRDAHSRCTLDDPTRMRGAEHGATHDPLEYVAVHEGELPPPMDTP